MECALWVCFCLGGGGSLFAFVIMSLFCGIGVGFVGWLVACFFGENLVWLVGSWFLFVS